MFTTPEYFTKILRPLGDVIVSMERHGVPFDRPAAEALLERIKADEVEVRAKLEDWVAMIGYPAPEEGVNWNSYVQLIKIIYNHIGLAPAMYWKKGRTGWIETEDGDYIEEYTGEGKLKTDDVALNWLGNKHPEFRDFLNDIRELRWVVRARNYVETWLGLCIYRDGWWWLHPSFGLSSDRDERPGARTGRFAVKNPALQQLPAHEDNYKLRSLFRAPNGYLLIEVDYAQLEVIVLAHICHRLFGTDFLVQRVQPGQPDMHSSTAKYVFGEVLGDPRIKLLPVEAIKKEAAHERFLVKSIRYGLAYMKGDQGFGDTLFDVTGEALGKARAATLREALFEFDPEIPMYHDFCRATAPRWGGAVSLFGRWSPLPHARANSKGLRNRAIRQFSNYGMQAGGQEITASSMILCHNDTRLHKLGAVQFLQVHDSNCFMVPEANAPAAMDIIVDNMVRAVGLDAPLAAEGKFGPSLQDTK